MVNSPLIRPYLLGGVALGGGTLDSHDIAPALIQRSKSTSVDTGHLQTPQTHGPNKPCVS